MSEHTSPLPYFSATGSPTALFSVAEGVQTDTLLECASGFLATAVDLGIGVPSIQDDGRWALVYLAEMAKALVDTAVSRNMKAPRGAGQEENAACKPAHVDEAIRGAGRSEGRRAPIMRTGDMIASIKESFGEHPEDVLASAKAAVEGFGWLNEILVSVKREAEGGNASPRVVKLAAGGAYLAADLENYFGIQHETMLHTLQEVGILPPDRRPLD